ncbi:tetratricopeptide repeat protein [Xenophilus arseniciresistens]|uniref:Tetratricopeptide repeat protein n=1 Tax=Xenophilus arseniciresistens TaxID=1283306 RepID=A0AAE3N4A9_9BURK|nr:tetratricopeptide repeat protein [Xenophilus arseniciresistens]MDA7415545.1 tetratricopeptide repeat protein [Xenophilus arseniciresistens]
MSFKPRRKRAALVMWTLVAGLAQAQPAPPAGPVPPAPGTKVDAPAPARPSAMTAQLFYEVLLGEISARNGDPADSFALLLEAARRSGEPELFQRAAEAAIAGRSPESALTAARAWQQAVPDSRDARRLELQVLIALGRLAETVQPLRAELAATPVIERPVLLTVIARNYGRAQDKKLAAQVVEQALEDDLRNPITAALSWTTVGRVRQLGGDLDGALAAAERGAAADPKADGPVVLALDLMDAKRPQAEALVKRYLQDKEALPEARVAYARWLVGAQRYDEATAQLKAVTEAHPAQPDPWLMLGTLQGQTRDDAAAQASLQRYLELAAAASDADERRRGMAQAYLQLSQLAERRKDYAAAEQWLSRIEDKEELFQAQTRRALLMGRQGQLPQARALLQQLPARTVAERKQRFMAQVQLLREARQHQAAYDLLNEGHKADAEDSELLYDLALAAEKLGRNDEMERHLRRVITLQPDNAHAYNALGYSLADRNLRLDEARTLIRKALELAPEDPFIADSLGWVEFRMGNTAEALRILEAAYRKRPDPEIAAHLGEVLWARGDRARAVTIWQQAKLADADNETLQETLKRLRVSP